VIVNTGNPSKPDSLSVPDIRCKKGYLYRNK